MLAGYTAASISVVVGNATAGFQEGMAGGACRGACNQQIVLQVPEKLLISLTRHRLSRHLKNHRPPHNSIMTQRPSNSRLRTGLSAQYLHLLQCTTERLVEVQAVLHSVTNLGMGPRPLPVQEAKGIILSPEYSSLLAVPAASGSSSSSSTACSAF